MTLKWEVGSFFHWEPRLFKGNYCLPSSHLYFGSGRDALKALITHGLSLGWERLFIPSYYCHDVTESVRALIPIEIYECNFLSERVDLQLNSEEAAIVVEYFGRKSLVSISGGIVIIDVTHDPLSRWSYNRKPNYTFASLRKFFHIPDGGSLWSLIGASLPHESEETFEHKQTSNLMLEAMVLKSLYLSGGELKKCMFLDLYRQAESNISIGNNYSGISRFSKSILPCFDVSYAQKKRASNCKYLTDCILKYTKNINIVASEAYFILLFNKADQRNYFKDGLIKNDIFPICLWPARNGEFSQNDIELSERVLMIHCDVRYTLYDMKKVADIIINLSTLSS